MYSIVHLTFYCVLMCWQLKEKTDKFEAEQAKKKAEFKSGKVTGRVSTKHSVFFVCVLLL